MTIYKLKTRHDGILLAKTENIFTMLSEISAAMFRNEAQMNSLSIVEYQKEEDGEDEKNKHYYDVSSWILKQTPVLFSAMVLDIQNLSKQIMALNAVVFPTPKEEPKTEETPTT